MTACRHCRPRARVYWDPDRYDGGTWVSQVDHGAWVEENFYLTWRQAMDAASFMAWMIRAGAA